MVAKSAPKSNTGRQDRDSWIRAALTTLYENGLDGVKVEPLASRLGVTKGSFYWHFRNREALFQAMISEWRRQQNQLLEKLREAPHRDVEERLSALMEFILSKDSRHDIGMRFWARLEPSAAEAIEEVDRARLAYCESIFHELGLPEEEALLRARVVYFYQVGEHTSSVRDEPQLRQRLSELRRQMLAAPPLRAGLPPKIA